METMAIWDAVCKTDPEYTTRVRSRGGYTAICAYYQIREATKLWGPAGGKWGWTYSLQWVNEGEAVHCDLVLRYPGGEVQESTQCDQVTHYGDQRQWDCDAPKKVTTDALTKALSRLGFSADIFLGDWDRNDNRYVQQERAAKPAPTPPPASPNPHKESSASLLQRLIDAKAKGSEAIKELMLFTNSVPNLTDEFRASFRQNCLVEGLTCKAKEAETPAQLSAVEESLDKLSKADGDKPPEIAAEYVEAIRDEINTRRQALTGE